ncbi:MAG: glycoside hydrolase family 55 protein [Armatimonadetes bacterium]|nr:glycoside hydrolase family 55 protein [Armatimonadota bacterium]
MNKVAMGVGVVVVSALMTLPLASKAPKPFVPTDDPLAAYKLGWTRALPWKKVIDIKECAGRSSTEKWAEALRRLGPGGGVVYFPPGVYRFQSDLVLPDNIILRGVDPKQPDAKRDDYYPQARFEFPRYVPAFTGEGTPTETAFKVIRLENPATASNVGILNIAVNRARVVFGGGADHRVGKNRFVVGCVLTNAAGVDSRIPDRTAGQHAWQRYNNRHAAAISVHSAENALIANNRLPEGIPDDFTMDGYVLLDRGKKPRAVDGVVFDYNNRPGIDLNGFCIGGAGGSPPDGTPETHPWGFRKGGIIRDNYIYSTGRTAISFGGDGTVCTGNVVRFKPDVTRWTATGAQIASGSSTNDNRAVQMRGWRWNVSRNDYEVYKNKLADSAYYFNDGEGLMHEDHCNSTIRDSRLIGNRGNAYLSLYKTAGIDGLLVENNEIRTDGGIQAIYVDANRNAGPFPCKNVTIRHNVTRGTGILIRGTPAAGNTVVGNRHIGPTGTIVNAADAMLKDNVNYAVKTDAKK